MAAFTPRMWLYHATQEARIFEGEKAINAALGNGWADSPGAVRALAAAVPAADVATPAEAALSKEELIAIAEELGIQIDRRWGPAKLQQAVDEATKG